MARQLVLVALLLVPVISALDLEAYCDSLHPAGADEGVYVCHPEQANAGIWCNRAGGVMYAKVTECAKGHFFSISKAVSGLLWVRLSSCVHFCCHGFRFTSLFSR